MTDHSLYLRAAAAVRAPEPARGVEGAGSDEQRAELHLDYFGDLLAPFGRKPDEELLRGGNHVSHSDLVDLLLADEGLAAAWPDLLILAQALPDVVPFTAVAPYLTARLGGRAVNFAVGQQGLAAPFTALRIAHGYARAGRSRQTVLAVLEQTTLPTEFELVQQTPLVDSAAALVLEAGAHGDRGPRFERVIQDVSSGAVARLIGGLDEGAGDTLLVLGPWVPRDVPLPPGPTVRRVRAGTYCTAVWLELARHWREWQESYRTVVLCDTDPRYGSTHAAVFRN